jgi:hypothetical protein
MSKVISLTVVFSFVFVDEFSDAVFFVLLEVAIELVPVGVGVLPLAVPSLRN